MNRSHLLLEKQDKIAWVSINRPKKLNALNREVLQELSDLFLTLNEDQSVRVIVFNWKRRKSICCRSRYFRIRRI